MQLNYIVPFTERFCDIDQFGTKKTNVMVGDLCVSVRHNGECPNSDELKSFLVGTKRKTIHIQAKDIKHCLEQFEAIGGGVTPDKSKSCNLIISDKDPIIEYTACPHMSKEFDCAYFDDDSMEPESKLACILNGCTDVHDECPIKQQAMSDQSVVRDGEAWVRRPTASLPKDVTNWKQVAHDEFFEAFNNERDDLTVTLIDDEWIDFKYKDWSLKSTGQPRFRAVEQMRFDETDHEEWESRYYIATQP
ncbi:hypothetical protein [Vibrio crassostreae]|uniref:hypothetical protein n=1 Tax=Vibrio crassostreae TaxID=246167 RepID=UPI001B310388|nr:hypothetical protein [Vibrio crassostreae]